MLSEPPVVRAVLRCKDLTELFDTTPDLCGADTDISRLVRDGDDNDVRVFWHELGGQPPLPEMPSGSRDELCAVALHRFSALI